MEIVVIGAVRVLGSLGVLRWAFVGALIAILVDFSDLFLKNLLDLGGLHNYQRFDKVADLVYMGAFLWVSRRWEGPAKTWAAALFAFRMVGLVAFEATEVRWILLALGNANRGPVDSVGVSQRVRVLVRRERGDTALASKSCP